MDKKQKDMPCPHCTAAQAKPNHGTFYTQCHGCMARHLAQSMLYRSAMQAGRVIPPYRRALKAAFGDDGWEAGHVAVKAQAQRIEAHRVGVAA